MTADYTTLQERIEYLEEKMGVELSEEETVEECYEALFERKMPTDEEEKIQRIESVEQVYEFLFGEKIDEDD